MNLNQFEYIIAVDDQRHFVKAASLCHITQATLSMMIKKLEEELGIKIFDRSRQPVKPTIEGEQIIEKARKIMADANSLKSYAKELKGEISGEVRIGIIPTLAPYLLPLFLKPFTLKYPLLKIYIKELITEDIVTKIKSGEVDIGLLASPLKETSIVETPLFYEEFFAYASEQRNMSKKKYLLAQDIKHDHLWLLEEGHCMRSQVFDLCELKKKNMISAKVHYEAGSIETLINLVDKNEGITIIPQLAAMLLKAGQKKNLRQFTRPAPVREIILANSIYYPRKKILEFMKLEILKMVPVEMKNRTNKLLLGT